MGFFILPRASVPVPQDQALPQGFIEDDDERWSTCCLRDSDGGFPASPVLS